jgi:hypothetical protein
VEHPANPNNKNTKPIKNNFFIFIFPSPYFVSLMQNSGKKI